MSATRMMVLCAVVVAARSTSSNPSHNGNVKDGASPTRPSWHLLLALWRPKEEGGSTQEVATTKVVTQPSPKTGHSNTHQASLIVSPEDIPPSSDGEQIVSIRPIIADFPDSPPVVLEHHEGSTPDPSQTRVETFPFKRAPEPRPPHPQVSRYQETEIHSIPDTGGATATFSSPIQTKDNPKPDATVAAAADSADTVTTINNLYIPIHVRTTVNEPRAESRDTSNILLAATISNIQSTPITMESSSQTILRTSQSISKIVPTSGVEDPSNASPVNLRVTTDQVITMGTPVVVQPSPGAEAPPQISTAGLPRLTRPVNLLATMAYTSSAAEGTTPLALDGLRGNSKGRSSRGKKVLELEGPVYLETLDGSSLAPFVGRSKEVLTLKGDGKAILAILQVAQGSNTLEDPFHVTSMIEQNELAPTDSSLNETLPQDQPESLVPTQDSHNTIEGEQRTSTGSVPDGVPLGRLSTFLKKNFKYDDDEKSFNSLDVSGSAEDINGIVGKTTTLDDTTTTFVDITTLDDAATTAKPIYEEISDALQVDTSIDDVEDFDVQIKNTEKTDEYLPMTNLSQTNLIDTDLHNVPENHMDEALEATPKQTPEVPSAPTTRSTHHPAVDVLYSTNDVEHSITTHTSSIDNLSVTHSSRGPPTLSAITSAQPLTTNSTFSAPHQPTIYSTLTASHPPTTPPTTESETANSSVSNDEDTTETSSAQDWSLFLANVSSLSNISLSFNESILQLSSGMSVEEHFAMVLKERGSLMLQLMDPSADPCHDFYQFACGRWNGKFPIRQDKAVDNTFERLKEDLDAVLRALLEEPPSSADNTITHAVKTLYKGCMDTDKIEDLGATPLLELLQELGGWPVLEGAAWNDTGYDWVAQMAALRNYNNDILVSEWVAADITNSSNHIIQLDQPELGLPGREYFINPGDHQYRMAYLTLMLSVTQMLGASVNVALRDMTDVLHFEKQLARILTAAEERRNLSAVHRRMTLDDLGAEVPEINWREYLQAMTWGNNQTEEVVVFGLDYFKKLVQLLQDTDNRTVSNYLLWRFVKNRISNLGERFTQVKQDYIKVLFGRKTQPERWRSCVTYVSGNLGYVVGAMFVRRYFPEASKHDTDEMIALIRVSFKAAMRGAAWMDPETRDVAVEKVDTIVKNVGYPDYLLNTTYMDAVYAELSFSPEHHFRNVLKMLQFHARTNHNLLSVPVNRTAWVTSPAVVNAYYSRSKNMIVFPAGILQPPFYHPAFPKSLNYGGIGVVIGHEITHGFDDRGRQFDKDGNLNQWWKPEDVSKFYQRASCMLDQYGEYKVEEVGLNINPVNTLGENIADNAGIKIAYQAYKRWSEQNEEVVTVPYVNLTHDQLFFLNFGQIWCEVNSPEAMLTKIRSGQHSPNKYRVIGTLSNSEEFSSAFNCPLGSPMNPKRKCKVW